jgi:NTE family protein
MTTLAEWLAQAPFALGMSSGFFSFYAHTGMLTALTGRGLVPARVAGSSAGAMVSGAWAAGASLEELASFLLALKRPDFWDPGFGAGLLAGKKFDALLRRVLPLDRIEDCRVPVQISVYDILARKTQVLERGDLATAIRASCAVPAMFQPVRIDGRLYWDGGILDRPGIAGVPPGRLLFHHISAHAPWSRANAPVLAIPKRADMVTLVLDDLPRANPWRLEAGREALRLAHDATARALDRPVGDIVRLSVRS